MTQLVLTTEELFQCEESLSCFLTPFPLSGRRLFLHVHWPGAAWAYDQAQGRPQDALPGDFQTVSETLSLSKRHFSDCLRPSVERLGSYWLLKGWDSVYPPLTKAVLILCILQMGLSSKSLAKPAPRPMPHFYPST